MVVKMTMDAGNFKKTAAEISRQIKNIDAEVKAMGGSDKAGKSKLEEKLSLQQKAVENLKAAAEKARAELSGADTDAQKLMAAKNLSTLETQLTTAEAKALALKNQLSAASLIKFGSLATNFGKSMRTMGRSLSLYVSAPLAALGGKAYKSALDYESATVSMQKTIDETDTTKYADITQAFKDMSSTGPVSFTELMELAGQAGSLGVGADQVVEFVQSVAMLSETADDLDASTGAVSLAKFLNVTDQGDFANIERTASALTELGNRMNATEGEIMQMAQRMASTGELAGLSNESILALAAGFTSVGIEAEAGGSAAGKLMKMMTLAAADGGMNRFSEIMNMDGAQFASAFKGDAGGTIIDFFDALGQLDETKDFGALTWLQENGFKEIRLSNLAAAAATNPDLFRTALNISKEAYAANTALSEEAAKRYGTAESYQRVQLNRMENASADVGENLVDPIQDIMTKVTDLLTKFSELDEGTQNWILGAAAGLVVGGPLMVGLGSVIETVGKITTAIGKAKMSTGTLQGLMSSQALWGIAAGGAVALLVVAITSLDNETQSIKESLKNIEFKIDETSYNETMAAINEMRNKANMLSGDEGTKNAGVSAAVQAGYGTNAMFGQAFGYETARSEQVVAETSGKYSAFIDDLNNQIVAAVGAGDTSLAGKLEEKRTAKQAEWDAAIMAERAAYSDIIGKLFAGMIDSPELKTSLEQASKDYDLFAAVTNAIEQSELGNDVDFGAILTSEIMERFFGNAYMRPSYANAVELKQAVAESLTESVKGVEGESVLNALWNAIINDPNASTMLDLTQTQGVFDGWVELMDFSKLGESAGQSFGTTLTPGLADPITDAIPSAKLNLQKLGATLAIEAAAQAALISNAFNAGLHFNVPGVGGAGGVVGTSGSTVVNNNVTVNAGSSVAGTGIYGIQRGLTDALNRMNRGYGKGGKA